MLLLRMGDAADCRDRVETRGDGRFGENWSGDTETFSATELPAGLKRDLNPYSYPGAATEVTASARNPSELGGGGGLLAREENKKSAPTSFLPLTYYTSPMNVLQRYKNRSTNDSEKTPQQPTQTPTSLETKPTCDNLVSEELLESVGCLDKAAVELSQTCAELEQCLFRPSGQTTFGVDRSCPESVSPLQLSDRKNQSDLRCMEGQVQDGGSVLVQAAPRNIQGILKDSKTKLHPTQSLPSKWSHSSSTRHQQVHVPQTPWPQIAERSLWRSTPQLPPFSNHQARKLIEYHRQRRLGMHSGQDQDQLSYGTVRPVQLSYDIYRPSIERANDHVSWGADNPICTGGVGSLSEMYKVYQLDVDKVQRKYQLLGPSGGRE